jgi:hypothetical protein
MLSCSLHNMDKTYGYWRWWCHSMFYFKTAGWIWKYFILEVLREIQETISNLCGMPAQSSTDNVSPNLFCAWRNIVAHPTVVSVRDNWLNQLTNVHETWHDHCPTWNHPIFVLFNFLTSVIPTCWLYEFLNCGDNSVPLRMVLKTVVKIYLNMVHDVLTECNMAAKQNRNLALSLTMSIWENLGLIISNCSACCLRSTWDTLTDMNYFF